MDNPDAIRTANNSLFSDTEEAQQQKKKAKLDLLQDLINNFDEKKLGSLTVPHLKSLAKERGVDIKGLTKKNDITQALINHSRVSNGGEAV